VGVGAGGRQKKAKSVGKDLKKPKRAKKRVPWGQKSRFISFRMKFGRGGRRPRPQLCPFRH